MSSDEDTKSVASQKSRVSVRSSRSAASRVSRARSATSAAAKSSRAVGSRKSVKATKKAAGDLLKQAEDDMESRLRNEAERSQELLRIFDEYELKLNRLKEHQQEARDEHQKRVIALRTRLNAVRKETEKLKASNQRRQERENRNKKVLANLKEHLIAKQLQLARFFVPKRWNIDVPVHPTEVFSPEFLRPFDSLQGKDLDEDEAAAGERQSTLIGDECSESDSEDSGGMDEDEFSAYDTRCTQRHWDHNNVLHDGEFVRSVVGSLTTQKVDDGTIIIAQGDYGAEMFFVAQGNVAITTRSGGQVAVLGIGDFFGEVQMLFPVPRIATVTALNESIIVRLSKADTDWMMKTFPAQAEVIRLVARERLDRWIANALAHSAVYAGKSGPSESAASARLMRPLHVQGGARLAKQNDVGLEMFFIVSGECHVALDGIHIAKLTAGHHVGELSLLHGDRRTADVVAVRETILLGLPWKVFSRWKQAAPNAAQALAAEAARRKELIRTIAEAIPVVPLFQKQIGVNDEFLVACAGVLRRREIEKGEVCIQKGQVGRKIWFVVSGLVHIEVDEFRRFKLGPGAFFGEIGVLFGSVSTASVVCEEGGVAYTLSSTDTSALTKRFPVEFDPLLSVARMRYEQRAVRYPGARAAQRYLSELKRDLQVLGKQEPGAARLAALAEDKLQQVRRGRVFELSRSLPTVAHCGGWLPDDPYVSVHVIH